MTSILWQSITDPQEAPTTPGVYMYQRGNKVIYIGKSINLRARLKSHAHNARHDQHERLIQAKSTKICYTLTDSDFLATLLEAKLIRQRLPKYNRILRDNKSYLYIVINLHDDFPKPALLRARDLPTLSDKHHVFGPFASRKIAEDILRTIRSLIPFCQQKNLGKRPCFYHKIGLCDPCPSLAQKDPGLTKKYRRQIKQIIRILSGNLTPVVTDLRLQLKNAASKQNYELALNLRDRLYRFESSLYSRSFTDYFSYSTADSSLTELAKLLSPHAKTKLALHRIEAYDASTFQLSNSVVSMVVTINGQLDKSQYRRFKMKNPRNRSDFEMLYEALARRLKNKTWNTPNLIVIDGGRPQLHKLQPLLDQLEHPPFMLGLAKHPDKIVLYPDTTINLPPDSLALHLLQRLRDEAHRFANSYRKLLSKQANLPQ